jgi:hypothetical protein
MRLTPAQINAIKSTATSVLGEGGQVWLDGSRLEDERRSQSNVIDHAPRGRGMNTNALLSFKLIGI